MAIVFLICRRHIMSNSVMNQLPIFIWELCILGHKFLIKLSLIMLGESAQQ